MLTSNGLPPNVSFKTDKQPEQSDQFPDGFSKSSLSNILKHFIETAADEVFWFDTQARVIYANHSACQKLGYNREDLIGMYVWDWDPHFPQDAMPDFLAHIRDKKYLSFESEHETRSGHRFPVEIRTHYFADGGNEYLLALATDISKVKREQQEQKKHLADEESFNQLILDNIPSPLFIKDSDFRIVKANKQFLNLYPEEHRDGVLGRTTVELYDAEESQRFLAEDLKALEEGYSEVEETILFPDGIKRTLSTRKKRIEDCHGNSFILASAIDISEKKVLEEQLRQSQKMEAIGQLAGGIAHDFNNQLGSILGFAELLEANLGDSDLAKYANKIISVIERSSKMTKQLLTFSRKQELALESIDVHERVHNFVELLKFSTEKRIGIYLDLRATDHHILGDKSLLDSTLLNLGINAIDAMPSGGDLTLETTIVEKGVESGVAGAPAQKSEPMLELMVKDSGNGIPADILPKIFEPFFTTKDKSSGTGLGLASVYGAVSQMHGTIEVKSTLKKGTCFKIQFPLHEVSKAKTALSEDAVEKLDKKSPSKTILVVDDEPFLRELTSDFLDMLGHKGLFAEDGREAVNLYRNHANEIDLVFLDMIMPVMDGSDTLKALQAINPDVKVIISTGYTAEHSVSELLDDGASGIIEKPFKLSQFKNWIERAGDL